MTFNDLIPVLHELPREDKIRAVEMLTAELGRNSMETIIPGAEYPIWTPLEAYDAAETLSAVLAKSRTQK